MCSLFWKDQLQRKLSALSAPERAHSVAVIGMGNELYGDDAVGLEVVRALKPVVAQNPSTLIIEAGLAPENCLGQILCFNPGLVIFVDAAQMDEVPGTIRWLERDSMAGTGFSTHTLSAALLLQFLSSEIGCDTAVIGIQPAQNQLQVPISTPVQEAVREVASGLEKLLAEASQ